MNCTLRYVEREFHDCSTVSIGRPIVAILRLISADWFVCAIWNILYIYVCVYLIYYQARNGEIRFGGDFEE